jgi:YVTN family beta-propeller protein
VGHFHIGKPEHRHGVEPPRVSNICGREQPGGAFLKGISFLGAVPVGVGPMDLALSEATNRLFVTNSGDGTISSIDAVGLRVESTFAVGGMPTGIDFTRNLVASS